MINCNIIGVTSAKLCYQNDIRPFLSPLSKTWL